MSYRLFDRKMMKTKSRVMQYRRSAIIIYDSSSFSRVVLNFSPLPPRSRLFIRGTNVCFSILARYSDCRALVQVTCPFIPPPFPQIMSISRFDSRDRASDRITKAMRLSANETMSLFVLLLATRPICIKREVVKLSLNRLRLVFYFTKEVIDRAIFPRGNSKAILKLEREI